MLFADVPGTTGVDGVIGPAGFVVIYGNIIEGQIGIGVDAPAVSLGRIAADGAVPNSQDPGVADAPAVSLGRIAADSRIFKDQVARVQDAAAATNSAAARYGQVGYGDRLTGDIEYPGAGVAIDGHTVIRGTVYGQVAVN